MEYFARNRFTVTRELFLEGMKTLSRYAYRRLPGIAAVLMGVLWLGLLILTWAAGGELLFTLGYLVLLIALWLWSFVGIPRRNARLAWKAQCGKYGTDMERITVFYSEHLVITGSGVEKTVLYSDILQIRQSRNLLILVCRDKVGVLLALNGFTGASWQEVRERLENKEELQ